jgi:hypothetical protein
MMGRGRRAVGAAAWLTCFAAVPACTAQALAFREVASARRPHPGEIEVESFLAEVTEASAGGGAWLLEAPTASALTGGRRPDGGDTELDLGVAIELPIHADRHRRLDLATALSESSDDLRRSQAAVALADLAAAFARAWLAQTEVELRAEDLAITETWLEATRRRVDAGADPPYEAILVGGERDRALLELVAARREVELAWGELAQLAAVALRPSPLELSSLPGSGGAPASNEPSGAAALTGIETRRNLEILLARARFAAAASRWAIAGDAAREGLEENIAHVGVAYRFARQGERAANANAQGAAEAAAESRAATDTAALRARLVAAQVALASEAPVLDERDLQGARRALESRLAEGKERASEVLPLRRQLLDAALASAAARAARAQAMAEIFLLEGGHSP